jgi:hypothetical protein
MQVITEANSTTSGADCISAADMAKLLIQVSEMGCTVEIYLSAAGTAPTVAGIIASNLKGTISPDPRYPLISSQ